MVICTAKRSRHLPVLANSIISRSSRMHRLKPAFDAIVGVQKCYEIFEPFKNRDAFAWRAKDKMSSAHGMQQKQNGLQWNRGSWQHEGGEGDQLGGEGSAPTSPILSRKHLFLFWHARPEVPFPTHRDNICCRLKFCLNYWRSREGCSRATFRYFRVASSQPRQSKALRPTFKKRSQAKIAKTEIDTTMVKIWMQDRAVCTVVQICNKENSH